MRSPDRRGDIGIVVEAQKPGGLLVEDTPKSLARGTTEILKEVPRYIYRDLSGNAISKQEARTIIKATWGDVEYN